MQLGLSGVLRSLLLAGEPVAHVLIARASGSTPREAGAAMLVTRGETFGTVGGGRLEWDTTARARALLQAGGDHAMLDIPLGPALGQCCGGHVSLAVSRADGALLDRIEAAEQDALTVRPTVLLFGAGHVGQALARALAPLPLRVRWIDGRAGQFAAAPPGAVAVAISDDWAGELARTPAGTVCVVLTHSHALDSLIVAAALERDDLAYVGLIGSQAKRRRFERGFRDIGISEARIARLVCPIGGLVRDKRPEVIAAFAAAELLQASLMWHAQPSLKPLPATQSFDRWLDGHAADRARR